MYDNEPTNIDLNPRFIDPDGFDNVPGTDDDDFRLKPSSPCIDAGSNPPVPADDQNVDEDTDFDEPTPDLDKAPRIENPQVIAGPFACSAHRVDMGSYEFAADCNQNGVPDADDIDPDDPDGNGQVSADINVDGVPDECQADCNNNSIDDACDIADCPPGVPACADCDENGVPDECEVGPNNPLTDCDNNNVPDACELAPCDTSIRYVDESATGYENGLSWQDAYTDLQLALHEAAQPGSQIDTIVVAEGLYPRVGPCGTYNPPYCPRAQTFQLITGVSIYGGFPSGGGSFAERDPISNETILSGDADQDDDPLQFPNGATYDDNKFHVVTGSGTDQTAILDGFTITGGFADWSYPDDRGGGLYIEEGSPTIRNCRFVRNLALQGGGGVYCNSGSSPAFLNCVFNENTSTGTEARGGAVFNLNYSSPMFTNCLFFGNSAVSDGYGGAICNMNQCYPMLVNCTLSANSADNRGGGLSNEIFCQPTIMNSVLWANTDGDSATPDTAQIYDWDGIEPSVSTVTFTCIEDDNPLDGSIPYGGALNGNIDDDPLFAGATDYSLTIASPCIDAGSNSVVPSGIVDDLHGMPRFVDEPGAADVGEGPVPMVDMGAYEFQGIILLAHGSKKAHGAAGDFLIPSGELECRDIQGSITVIFEYDRAVYSEDGDAFAVSDFATLNGECTSVSQSPDLKTLEIECGSVDDAACFQIAFVVENVVGNELAQEFTWPILAGDVDRDGLVDSADRILVASANGLPADETNFDCDVDSDGAIEGSATAPVGEDWAFVNAALHNGVLPCWPVNERAASRKYHADRYYEINSGGVEPRTGDLVIVFEFDRLMRSLDDDALAPADFTVSSGTVTAVDAGWDWSMIKVTVSGATDQTPFVISFDGEDEYEFAVHTEKCWGLLVGDVNGDAEVTASDTSQITTQNQRPITSSNFRCDVDADGTIEGASPTAADHDLADANVGETVDTCE